MRFKLNPLSSSGLSTESDQPVRVVQSSNGYIGETKISGLITAGANVSLAGTGTKQDPYVITSSGGGGGGTISDGDKGDITVSSLGTVWTIDSGLPATRIGAGTVDNTEYGYLDGVTSSIQTQLNGKQATITNSDSITQGSTNLFLTSAERTKLSTTSGTNTGDQTITLTGDVTGSGTGSFVTTIKTDAALAGNPTTTTQTAGNSSTRIATTAFVATAITNAAATYDDVKDYANLAAFPATGVVDVLYMANDTNFVYRWGGSSYIQVGGGTPADATTSSKGIVQLAGDLGGTATAPTTPTAVHLTGNETVAGTKTFSAPVKLTPQSPTYAANTLVADSTTDSLTYYNSDANVGLQVGQEEWIRVINNTGATIANGAAVYLSGASGTLPTIALANASAGATTICAGLATESIANGATGFVTCIGNVNGIDTSGFTAGQTVYVSATTAGALTATAPVAPNFRYRIGIVGVSSATVGTIHVTPSTAALGNGTANQLFGINTAGTGQELKSLVAGTNVTITPGTGTLTIAATGGSGGTTVNYYSPVLAQEFTYSASNAFTLSQTPGAILSVTIQGQVLQSSEYGVAGSIVTVTPASHTFTSGDIVRIEYQATTAFSSTGGFTANIRTVTASTTVLSTDRTILVDTTAGAVTLTYPQTNGQEWKFKKITTDANAMIITGATGQTEAGANITATSTTRPSYTIQSNGTNGYAL